MTRFGRLVPLCIETPATAKRLEDLVRSKTLSTWRRAAHLAAGAVLASLFVPGLVAGGQAELSDVRAATAQFHSVDAAIEAGYELGYVNGSNVRIITGCVAHPTAGAMGYHYFNKALIDDLVINVTQPEGLVYSPGPDGRLRLVAVEYVVPGMLSNPPGVSSAPTVFGQEMVILVPAVGFYTLHAWIWSNNPAGLFASWSPEVSCT
jgi:hypothetical protein